MGTLSVEKQEKLEKDAEKAERKAEKKAEQEAKKKEVGSDSSPYHIEQAPRAGRSRTTSRSGKAFGVTGSDLHDTDLRPQRSSSSARSAPAGNTRPISRVSTCLA